MAFFNIYRPITHHTQIQIQIINSPTLKIHIPATPDDLQSCKITRIDHNRIRRINGQRILFQMFESYVLRINIIYNTLHILRHIQSHVSYIHSHKFGFLKLLRKLIQRIVQKDFQRVPHNGHFQIVIYLLRARKQILPFFWRLHFQKRIRQPDVTFWRIQPCLSQPDHPASRHFFGYLLSLQIQLIGNVWPS